MKIRRAGFWKEFWIGVLFVIFAKTIGLLFGRNAKLIVAAILAGCFILGALVVWLIKVYANNLDSKLRILKKQSLLSKKLAKKQSKKPGSTK